MAFDPKRLINEPLMIICKCQQSAGTAVQPGRVESVTLLQYGFNKGKWVLKVACNQCGTHYHNGIHNEAELIKMFPVHNALATGFLSPPSMKKTAIHPDLNEGERDTEAWFNKDQPMTPRQRHEWFCEQMRRDF